MCVTAFASAIKNITIYPANHPRVIERATAFVAENKALTGPVNELIIHQDELALDGVSITTDHLAVDWLRRRCRETGIGSIRIERGCAPDDVIAFASALINCRPGSGRSLPDAWRDESASIRPVALVIEEHRSGQNADGTNADEEGKPAATVQDIDPNASLQEKLQAIAKLPSVRELANAITTNDASDEQATETFDLLSIIMEVLPVDCPTDPEGLQETIENILRSTHAQLQTAGPSDDKARTAELLRSAVDIAKTYFGRSNKGRESTAKKPSGRPGDEVIQADLAAFLRELAELPDASDLRLPPAAVLAEDAPTTTKELLGICLYGLASNEGQDARSNRIRIIAALVQQRPDDCIEMLDTYLLAGSPSTAVRLTVLRILALKGLDAIIRDRNYLDDALLRAGFPEVLPIAARILTSPAEQARMREALDDLATVIENGGAQALAASGLLDDVATVQMLANCGGKIAPQLLADCESAEPGVQDVLLDYVKRLELPECESVAVNICATNAIPDHYVRRLLRAATRKQVNSAMRNASGKLIRRWLQAHMRLLPAATLAPAVAALKHVPSPETEQFLRELSRLGRFSFSSDLRELRRHAAQTLKTLKTKVRS